MNELNSDIHNFVQSLAFDTARLAEPEIAARLVLQVFLFLASAFFSSSETSLFSLSRLDLQKLRRNRHPQANNLYRLLEQPRRHLRPVRGLPTQQGRIGQGDRAIRVGTNPPLHEGQR